LIYRFTLSEIDFPDWSHAGGGKHEAIAHAYWNWFKEVHKNSILAFSDEPDFFGELYFEDSIRRFWGDIGLVSAFTFASTQKMLGKGDLWISLPNIKTQVIIEPMISISDLYGIELMRENDSS